MDLTNLSSHAFMFARDFFSALFLFVFITMLAWSVAVEDSEFPRRRPLLFWRRRWPSGSSPLWP